MFVGSTAELQKMLKKDEVIEGKAETSKETIFKISKLGYVKNGIMLQDILDGKEMEDAVLIEQDLNPNYDKDYFVFKGSSRIEAAL